jgi:hypothetical protein
MAHISAALRRAACVAAVLSAAAWQASEALLSAEPRTFGSSRPEKPDHRTLVC